MRGLTGFLAAFGWQWVVDDAWAAADRVRDVAGFFNS
jgi:hypothetical protein